MGHEQLFQAHERFLSPFIIQKNLTYYISIFLELLTPEIHSVQQKKPNKLVISLLG